MKLLVALLLLGALHADRNVGAQLLYWKPTTGGFDASQALTIRPDYQAGVRAFASLHNFHLSGLYFRSSDGSTARLTFRYWNGELALSYPFLPSISASATVRYIGLEELQQVGADHLFLQLYGAGPGFGLSSRFSLSSSFFFDAQVKTFALIAERKTTGYAHEITILPTFDMRMAFRYASSHFSGALGYSLDYIFDAVKLRHLRDTGFAGPFAEASLLF